MAVASTKTKLPLTTWARIMGVHPLHFEQVRIGNNPHCDQIVFQHPWQTAQHVSREDIGYAIAEAEAQIENYLQFRLKPTWEVDEWQHTIRPVQAEMFNMNNRDIRGLPTTVAANWGYFIQGGVEAKSLILANAPIVYFDEDGDAYKETATVNVPTTLTDPNEIAVYYPGEDAEDIWEIRPVEVVIAGGVATITFRREQAVAPELFNVLDIEDNEAIGTDDTDFLTTVDVYRHWNNPMTQADLMWEPGSSSCGNCTDGICEFCAYAHQTGCLYVRGTPRQSIIVFHPANWDDTTGTFATIPCCLPRQPDIVKLNYYAGWQNKRLRYTNRMDPEWERVVAYMATAKLERPPCDCMSGFWNRWAQDITLVAGDEDGKPFYRDPTGSLDNPFGTRRGELYAWRKVKDMMRGRSVYIV